MPASRRLSALLDGPDAPHLVRAVARAVAGFHREAPTSPRIAEAGGIAVVLGLWEEGLDQLAGVAPEVVPREDVERARTLARAYLGGRRALLERRIADGWVRDGHGDLLADDVFCLSDGPRVLDCLAFDDRLRHGDVLGDVAFLAMDLEAHGHPELGGLLMDEWRRDMGESHPSSLAHHYLAYRAHVRSKVAALRSGQGRPGRGGARPTAPRPRDHAPRAGAGPHGARGGAPGTGKSTLARALGDATGWAVLRSDEIRKDLAGLPHTPADPGGFGLGLYAPETSDRVYAQMLDRAAAHLTLGESVVLDASWSAGARRAAARRVASACDAEVIEIRCRLAPAIANARIRARRAAGEGSSDATPEIAERLAAGADPWPEARSIGTDAPPGQVLREARRLVGPV